MKLHPLSIPYRILQAGSGLIALIFFVAFSIGQVAGGFQFLLLVGLLLLGILGTTAWQIAYYKRFEYELTPDTFDIRSGVISRRNREIPLRRIQNVDITRNVFQRVLGVAELRIETAGGSESEARLRYVGYDEAKRLQNTLRRRSDEQSAEEIGAGEASDEVIDPRPSEELLYAITPSDLAVLAIASFDLRVASFLFVLLSVAAPSVIFDLVVGLPINPLIVVALALVFVVVASAVVSGASAVFNTYGFRLTRQRDELRYERGLFQRFDGSIPLDKVQTLVVQENVLMRLFGFASLTVETAGYAPGQGSVNSASAVPIADRDQTISIARAIEPFEDQLAFERPARRARIRYTIRYVLVVLALTAIAFGIVSYFEFGFEWYALLAGLVLAPLAAHLKWTNRGYYVDEEYLITRDGFWNRKTHVVPYYRVQTVIESQTILQRRWRIGTVLIDTAGASGIVGGSPRAFDLDEGDATRLRDLVAEQLQDALVRHADRTGRERTFLT